MPCCGRGRFLFISLSVLVFLLSPCPLVPRCLSPCPPCPSCPLVPLVCPLAFVPLVPCPPYLSPCPPCPPCLFCPLVPLTCPPVPLVHLSPLLVSQYIMFPLLVAHNSTSSLFLVVSFTLVALWLHYLLYPHVSLALIAHFSSMIMYIRREERETERK